MRDSIPRRYATRLCSEVHAEVQNTITDGLRRRAAGAARLLDVGCWDGAQTMRYAAATAARPWGIELFPGPAADAAARGVSVVRVDLERERFPFADETFDVIVINQVLEHLKNVWLPLAECYRVLATGGLLVASVPNLASLHNRVLLAFGAQPTSIRVRGPHVRGYTASEFTALLRLGGAFALEHVDGVGFHPLPPRAARPLARAWGSASHTPVFYARKQAHQAPDPWTAYRAAEEAAGEQTSYPGYGEPLVAAHAPAEPWPRT